MNYRIQRITGMELMMDRVSEALHSGLPVSSSIRRDLKRLEKYYQTDWLSDYEADERGELPADLKRGILSEDALYDLLQEADKKF